MKIDIIDTVDRFLALRRDWEAVYAADPEAQFFLSWAWYSKWIRHIEGEWLVLAARPDSGPAPYVAFFPLRVRVKAKEGGGAHRVLLPAGNRAADYTGFLCTPAAQSRAIPAFARRIKTLSWVDLDLECFNASPERTRLFLAEFPSRDFAARGRQIVNAADGVDNSICPYVELPGDWDSYLASLGPNTRQKARRFLRKLDLADGLRITLADASTIRRDLDILLQFWTAKWGARKGESAPVIARVLGRMLAHCHETDTLFMPVLWRGDEALGALGILVDRQKRSLLFYVSGCNTITNNPPPGFLLHAYSIRHAIEAGFTTYDFLRGNEPYKYAFGPKEHRIGHIVLRAKREVTAGPARSVLEIDPPIWQPPANPFAPRFGRQPTAGLTLPGARPNPLFGSGSS
jgi:CelD/BcsL family acetyltransferase involved in cellulose biosynthesis